MLKIKTLLKCVVKQENNIENIIMNRKTFYSDSLSATSMLWKTIAGFLEIGTYQI